MIRKIKHDWAACGARSVNLQYDTMEFKRLKEDRYLLLLLILAVVFVVYWALFANYRYTTFSSSYYDLGVEAYSLYWHVHGINYYPNVLDYLVFTNHLSIFSTIIVPVFALFQVPMTFLLIQDILLAVTAILVYFTASGILESRKIGFAMAFAFLINPATVGLTLFDFHLESIAVFFYVLSFYFYMKERRAYFLISYVLLLSLYDVEPFVGVFLLLGLLVYEIIYHFRSKGEEKSKYRKRLKLLIAAFILTVIFVVFYVQTSNYITRSYSATPPNEIVPIQRLKGYISEQFSVLTGSSTFKYSPPSLAGGAIIGLITFFFSFGISSLANPVISLILYAPWLLEVLVIHNYAFTVPASQNYSFALGGSIVSAILGYMIITKGRISFLKFDRNTPKRFENKIFALIIILAIVIGAYNLVLVRHYLLLNYAPKLNYTQLGGALTMIPLNATVMAQANIAPHLYYIHGLELPPVDQPAWFEPVGVQVYWTKPDYIIVDKDIQGYSELINSSTFNIYNFTKDNYTIYYNKSDIYIYKRLG